VVAEDFTQIGANGFNAVRTYTVPPRWLLDLALAKGLWIMVGIPWEQHITFLDDPKRVQSIIKRVDDSVRTCAGHPAVLCYTIGNEIPASIVRWYGQRRVEQFLQRLYHTAKTVDPAGLVTYVNFPTTEYLDLPFIDIYAFNVYLETEDRLAAYLARLQNLAGERPLLMAEIGLDSHRNTEHYQAEALDWQIRTVARAGVAGAFIFAWTDEWYRGGHDILDWDFGLTRRDRSPKPALAAAAAGFAEFPCLQGIPCPRISVVVCTYNGACTLGDCLSGLMALDYPDYEVIVVDDGSTDATAEIAGRYTCQLIRTPNHGLSSARNIGIEAATGTIVAFIDDDARPDPDWLRYLAITFADGQFVGVGGPNIAPPDDGLVAECVANAPGGPIHVLLDDREAEHIPGCNMAFYKTALQAVGGFDPQFRVAGDDVDICWRIQACGWKIGFSPAAMVWHHRRNNLRGYWLQQRGYGKAEALLERKWPEKYNASGHLSWSGRLYGKGLSHKLLTPGRIYHGTWGSAPFQSLYQPADGLWSALPLMPEWYLLVGVLLVLSLLGISWPPLLLALPLMLLGLGTSAAHAVASARRGSFRGLEPGWRRRWFLTSLLHLVQPLARLYGRLSYGLTPWRRRARPGFALPVRRVTQLWSEQWVMPETWLEMTEQTLRQAGCVVQRGDDYASWDLYVRGGPLSGARLRMVIEEHAAGCQLLRFKIWPVWSVAILLLCALLVALAGLALHDGAWLAGAMISLASTAVALRHAHDCAISVAAFTWATHKLTSDAPPELDASPGALQPQTWMEGA